MKVRRRWWECERAGCEQRISSPRAGRVLSASREGSIGARGTSTTIQPCSKHALSHAYPTLSNTCPHLPSPSLMSIAHRTWWRRRSQQLVGRRQRRAAAVVHTCRTWSHKCGTQGWLARYAAGLKYAVPHAIATHAANQAEGMNTCERSRPPTPTLSIGYIPNFPHCPHARPHLPGLE